MYEDTFEVSIKGVTPMILHNGRTANPLDPYSKKLKSISSKKNKTDEDLENLLSIQWKAALYYDEEIGLYMPSVNMAAAFYKAAKKLKSGNKCSGISFNAYPGYPIITDNHKNVDEMEKDPSNRYDMMVTIDRRKVLARRPVFRDWSMDFSLAYDRDILDPNEIKSILDIMSKRVGLGSWTPSNPKPGIYGKFVITKLKHIDGKSGKVTQFNFNKE